MTNLKLKQLRHEIDTWKRMLSFMEEENIHLKNRLSDVLKDRFDKKMLDNVEGFQNSFIKGDQLLSLLKKDLADLEKRITTEVSIEEGINTNMELAIKKMRIAVDKTEKNFTTVNCDFNNYLSENL